MGTWLPAGCVRGAESEGKLASLYKVSCLCLGISCLILAVTWTVGPTRYFGTSDLHVQSESASAFCMILPEAPTDLA